MTINQLAAARGYRQYPYLNEAGCAAAAHAAPDPAQPQSDPFYVDVSPTTQRLLPRPGEPLRRPALFPAPACGATTGRARALPAPRRPSRTANSGAVIPASIPSAMHALCAGRPAAGAVQSHRGRGREDAPALPPNALFALAAPPADPVHFNALLGAHQGPGPRRQWPTHRRRALRRRRGAVRQAAAAPAARGPGFHRRHLRQHPGLAALHACRTRPTATARSTATSPAMAPPSTAWSPRATCSPPTSPRC